MWFSTKTNNSFGANHIPSSDITDLKEWPNCGEVEANEKYILNENK